LYNTAIPWRRRLSPSKERWLGGRLEGSMCTVECRTCRLYNSIDAVMCRQWHCRGRSMHSLQTTPRTIQLVCPCSLPSLDCSYRANTYAVLVLVGVCARALGKQCCELNRNDSERCTLFTRAHTHLHVHLRTCYRYARAPLGDLRLRPPAEPLM
jgi:hypothetical protein